ncbi:helix-turn-helix transcriptional regulator [Planotetraspora silvatica]|uniref:helix-turn-helix transcriptional regulator n=1 Tax=Planotetraspora silvatica TaxID=234614 RepID=UPI0023B29A8F|nr:LuxR family transcriptional regulator [Planotetraspora silvatica]
MGGSSHNDHEAAGEPGFCGSSRLGWRGRAREWKLVVGLLQAAKVGRGGIVLVEGRSGAGKSRLLGMAVAAAATAGFGVAQGAADELTQLIPLAPLISALEPSGRTLPADDCLALAGPADQRLLLVERLLGPLEQRVAQGPMLLALDDVQWADPMTLVALRSMTRDLASYPLVWMLTRTTGSGDCPRLNRLFDVLERDGAIRITLEALDERAVADVVTDVLGAAPEPDVLALAGIADGNPFLLVDLLEKLKGEGVFHIADGHVGMDSARLPRAQVVTQERLNELSERTRHLLQVAAVLGRSFSVKDLAEILGESTIGLLPMVEEAMSAGIVEPAGDQLTFRHDLLWQAVVGTIPTPVRQALHRDAGEMLLKRGGSAVPAAAHLIHSAGRGDESALRGLGQAAREVLRSSPQTAADLALRALELSDPADPDWVGRAATAADALTAIGRLPEAADLARGALSKAPPAQAPHLRCALAYILLLSGRPADAVAEAESLLTQHDVPDDLRGIAEWTVCWGLICLNDFGKGRLRAESVLAERERHTDAAVVGALLLLARFAVADGRVADSFAHLHEALQIANSGTVEAIQRPYTRLLLSLNWRAMRQFEESDIAIQAAEEEIKACGLTVLAAQPALFRSVVKLAAGRLDDAAAEAQAGLMIADELGTHGFIRVGVSMLALIAMRRGDIDAAVRHIERYHSIDAAPGMLFGSVWERWVMAAVVEAQGDPDRAVDILHAIYTDKEERCWALLTTPLTAAWMTRLALATANRPYAQTIVDTVEYLAQSNPDFPALATTAAHARGILYRDPGALASAAADQPEPWARASGAEDLGVLLSTTPGASAREQAIASLDQALDGYEHIGALRDAARVRARLRALGVRRRHWAQLQRPAFGWDSLTDTERAVAVLIARGMTNRQAAARMFLSPHTVSTHLRRMFSKLDIASRVELACIVAEECPDLLKDT